MVIWGFEQIDGTLLAPPKIGSWPKSSLYQWINFKWLQNFTIRGTGTADGQGSNWWCSSQVNQVIINFYISWKKNKLFLILNVSFLLFMQKKRSKKVPDTKPTVRTCKTESQVKIKLQAQTHNFSPFYNRHWGSMQATTSRFVTLKSWIVLYATWNSTTQKEWRSIMSRSLHPKAAQTLMGSTSRTPKMWKSWTLTSEQVRIRVPI